MVRVMDAFAAPVKGATIALAATSGTVSPSTLSSDENGRGTALLVAQPGNVRLTATVDGTTLSNSTNVAIQQTPPGPPNPQPPPPSPNPQPPDPTGPLTVTINATPQPVGLPTGFGLATQSLSQAVWTFGDGATETSGASTSHVYQNAGTYTVSVTVTDTRGRTASASTTINIPSTAPAPQPTYLVTLAASPATVTVGGTSTLTATARPDNNAPAPASFAWDCNGDGITDFNTATNSQVCTYPGLGTITSRVTVTGGTATGTAQTTVTVNPTLPPSYTVTLSASPTSVTAGNTSTLTATVMLNNGAPAVANYAWDCDGDGTTDATSTAPLNTNACLYPIAGSFTARVTATGGAVSGSGTTKVTVNPHPTPVVTVSCGQGAPLTANCVVSATLNGAPVPSSTISHVDWDWGDSKTSTTASNVGSHPYGVPNPYTIMVSNVTMSGTTQKGTGSTTITIVP